MAKTTSYAEEEGSAFEYRYVDPLEGRSVGATGPKNAGAERKYALTPDSPFEVLSAYLPDRFLHWRDILKHLVIGGALLFPAVLPYSVIGVAFLKYLTSASWLLEYAQIMCGAVNFAIFSKTSTKIIDQISLYFSFWQKGFAKAEDSQFKRMLGLQVGLALVGALPLLAFAINNLEPVQKAFGVGVFWWSVATTYALSGFLAWRALTGLEWIESRLIGKTNRDLAFAVKRLLVNGVDDKDQLPNLVLQDEDVEVGETQKVLGTFSVLDVSTQQALLYGLSQKRDTAAGLSEAPSVTRFDDLLPVEPHHSAIPGLGALIAEPSLSQAEPASFRTIASNFCRPASWGRVLVQSIFFSDASVYSYAFFNLAMLGAAMSKELIGENAYQNLIWLAYICSAIAGFQKLGFLGRSNFTNLEREIFKRSTSVVRIENNEFYSPKFKNGSLLFTMLLISSPSLPSPWGTVCKYLFDVKSDPKPYQLAFSIIIGTIASFIANTLDFHNILLDLVTYWLVGKLYLWGNPDTNAKYFADHQYGESLTQFGLRVLKFFCGYSELAILERFVESPTSEAPANQEGKFVYEKADAVQNKPEQFCYLTPAALKIIKANHAIHSSETQGKFPVWRTEKELEMSGKITKARHWGCSR